MLSNLPPNHDGTMLTLSTGLIEDAVDLIDGTKTLPEFVAATETKVDDQVLAGAQQALHVVSDNLPMIKMFMGWLKVPVTFAATATNSAGLASDNTLPAELAAVPGIHDLKGVLLDSQASRLPICIG